MRPQGLHYTIDNTLYVDADTIANVTLLRAPDMPTFDAEEVRDFEALTPHLGRVLGLAMRLEHETAERAQADALHALPQPVALVRRDLYLVYANPAMERLLGARRGLSLRAGRLSAAHADGQAALASQVAAAAMAPAPHADVAPALWLRSRDGRDCVRAEVLPCAQREIGVTAPRRLALVIVHGAPAGGSELAGALVHLHGLTPAEARLAAEIADGTGLREAAARQGITYGSARIYLKAVYRKLDVHDRAQLVGRLARLGTHS